MNILLTMSRRNLMRQKRRTILLGFAIAFGAMVLIVANSYSNGISDTLLNRVIKFVAGHISVTFGENNNLFKSVFHDGNQIIDIINKNIPAVTFIRENVRVFCRVMGNGRSDNVVLTAIDITAEKAKGDLRDVSRNFRIIAGSFENLKRTDVGHPTLVSKEKARYLNISMGDIINVKFQDLYGQSQCAQLTVAGIFTPVNTFMSMPIFLEAANLKKMLGYNSHDIAQLSIMVKNPKKNAGIFADKLHTLLEPRPGIIYGELTSTLGVSDSAAVLGMKVDSAARVTLLAGLPLVSGDTAAAFGPDGTVLSSALAASLKVTVGDTCRLTYAAKYDSAVGSMELIIRGIADARLPAGVKAAFINDNQFYTAYYGIWPADAHARLSALVPDKANPLYGALAPEWLLLKRARTTAETRNQYKHMSRIHTRAVRLDVRSMYESASLVVNLEAALKLITFSAVLTLFFIVLIGVVNSLRMSIRERTREIGTLRALGMQRRDVRNCFIYETFFLAFFACLIGTATSFLLMWLLSSFPINDSESPLSILMIDNRLYFAPTMWSVVACNAIIIGIAAMTAWFPARRAANLSSAAALRHYE